MKPKSLKGLLLEMDHMKRKKGFGGFEISVKFYLTDEDWKKHMPQITDQLEAIREMWD